MTETEELQKHNQMREPEAEGTQGSPSETVAHKLDLILDRFPRDDGKRWRGVDIERATGGEVSSSYFSGLRRAKFDHPGMKHLSLIADVMGFPFELWRLDPEDWEEEIARHQEYFVIHGSHQVANLKVQTSSTGPSVGQAPDGRTSGGRATMDQDQDPFVAAFGLYEEDVTVPESPRIPAGEELANLLNILFESKPDPRTKRSYTSDRVARLSRDRLTPEQIARMRAGGQTEPPAEITMIALSQVFGIPVSYWHVSDEARPVIDLDHLEEALAEILADDRMLIVRSGKETEELTISGNEDPEGRAREEKVHQEQVARKLVAAMINRLINVPQPTESSTQRSRRGKRTRNSGHHRQAAS